jgi:hypothetical protein
MDRRRVFLSSAFAALAPAFVFSASKARARSAHSNATELVERAVYFFSKLRAL